VIVGRVADTYSTELVFGIIYLRLQGRQFFFNVCVLFLELDREHKCFYEITGNQKVDGNAPEQ
jgi:hypothetical protein